MSLYGYSRATPELEALPKIQFLSARFEPVETPDDFGAVWRALEVGMTDGEILAARNPYFATVYNALETGQIHSQASKRPSERRPAEEQLQRFWDYCAVVAKLRGFVLVEEAA